MANVLNLIERHMALWDLKRRLLDLGQRPGRCLQDGVAYGPCLLISRQRGSGGSALASLLGKRLGWHVFDKEILSEIAQLAQLRTEIIESVDPTVRGQWKNGWEPELRPDDIGLESYLRFLRQVVLTLGHHGDVVILGRGAQHLLPAACALRLRIVAPLELRVQHLMSTGLDEREVRGRIEKNDAERAAFTRACFHCDIDSPLAYDLVLNTGEIPVENSVSLVLEALRNKLGVQS